VIGQLATPGFADGLALSGSIAYVVDQHTTKQLGGLRLIDVTDPAAPMQIGSLDALKEEENFRDVAVRGGHAYVADSRAGLHVIDVTDPSEPRRVGHLAVPSGAYAVGYADGYAYVSEDGGAVVAVDVSDPAAPKRVGELDVIGGAFHFAFLEDHLLVAEHRWTMDDDTAGMSVIDRRDPANLRQVARVTGMGSGKGIAVHDGLACVGDEDEDVLWVIDVSVPEKPEVVHGGT
jgi:hypothetical protein